MLKNFLRVSISITFVSGFFVLFSSSQICGSDSKDCMDKREAAVKLQLHMHELCNDITGKPVSNSNDAIGQLELVLRESGNTDLLSEIGELKIINREGNKAKHDWTTDYCHVAGDSASRNQARQIRAGQSSASARKTESQTGGTQYAEQRWAPMPAAQNTSYGGVGQNLSHLGSAVMGPPPPTPYEGIMYRVNDGTATSDDLRRLGIGASINLDRMFETREQSISRIDASILESTRQGNRVYLERVEAKIENGDRLDAQDEKILAAAGKKKPSGYRY